MFVVPPGSVGRQRLQPIRGLVELVELKPDTVIGNGLCVCACVHLSVTVCACACLSVCVFVNCVYLLANP